MTQSGVQESNGVTAQLLPAPARHEEIELGRRLTGVARTVEMTSCILRVDSISWMPLAGFRSVAIRVVIRQTRIPTAEMSRG